MTKKEEDDVIISVQPDTVDQTNWMTDADGNYRFQRIAVPTLNIDPDTGSIKDKWTKYEQTPADNSSPALTVTEDLIRIKQLLGDGDMANVAGDRTITITVTKQIAGASVVTAHSTASVTLTQNQNGSIFMPGGSTGLTYLNDNGTITSESTSIVGMELEEGDTVTLAIAGAGVNAGDRCRLQVFYEVVKA